MYLAKLAAIQNIIFNIMCLFIPRPSSKPICDQQFLGEAQSSTAVY
ncbi:MAG: hypothetical protein NMK33_05605 [Candidatus Cardinium sp.]|nr:hypothetical protein [Cardinium endosymbiont of Dermatophagoides farinae]UWW96893.1 MAG: hypothetical protein NMK33_05605 [Candidatus Cardinium sp.]